jgi:hypothetical protein
LLCVIAILCVSVLASCYPREFQIKYNSHKDGVFWWIKVDIYADNRFPHIIQEIEVYDVDTGETFFLVEAFSVNYKVVDKHDGLLNERTYVSTYPGKVVGAKWKGGFAVLKKGFTGMATNADWINSSHVRSGGVSSADMSRVVDWGYVVEGGSVSIFGLD